MVECWRATNALRFSVHSGDAHAHVFGSSGSASAGADHSSSSVPAGASSCSIAADLYWIIRSDDESPAVDTSQSCGCSRSDIVGMTASSMTFRWIFQASSANTIEHE
jgi:hypothetical protein